MLPSDSKTGSINAREAGQAQAAWPDWIIGSLDRFKDGLYNKRGIQNAKNIYIRQIVWWKICWIKIGQIVQLSASLCWGRTWWSWHGLRALHQQMGAVAHEGGGRWFEGQLCGFFSSIEVQGEDNHPSRFVSSAVLSVPQWHWWFLFWLYQPRIINCGFAFVDVLIGSGWPVFGSGIYPRQAKAKGKGSKMGRGSGFRSHIQEGVPWIELSFVIWLNVMWGLMIIEDKCHLRSLL